MLAAGVLAAGCGSPETGERVEPDDKLGVDYRRLGGEGFIDQTITIRSSYSVVVALTLRFEPLDESGEPLPGLRVETAYGSDEGRLLIPPDGSLDILAFRGKGARRVRDVRTTVAQLKSSVGEPPDDPIEAEPLNAAGQEVDYTVPFASVRLLNPNPVPVDVRAVAILYERPPPGAAQQFLSVASLSGLREVPANGEVEVEIPKKELKATRGYAGWGSVKAYLSR